MSLDFSSIDWSKLKQRTKMDYADIETAKKFFLLAVAAKAETDVVDFDALQIENQDHVTTYGVYRDYEQRRV